MVLKYYYDLLSQPSRALYIFFKLSKLPFESCPVALRKGEHLSEEFKEKYNRFGKVPFIHDGDFKLAESVAIVRYVTEKYGIDNELYPKNLEKRARIDEYLEWQHNNTRAFCALYFQKKWLIPLLTGKPANPETVQKFQQNMENCLDQIQEIFLKNSKYIAGDQLTLADIFAACEIEQPRVAGYDPTENRPILAAWLNRVRNDTNPIYQETHLILNKMAQMTKSQKAKL